MLAFSVSLRVFGVLIRSYVGSISVLGRKGIAIKCLTNVDNSWLL